MVNGRLLEPPHGSGRAARQVLRRGEPRGGRRARRRGIVVIAAAAARGSRSASAKASSCRRRCCAARGRHARRPVRHRRPDRSGSSTSPRPATSPPTRSCAPASRPRSRTSCGRRSRGCSRCSSSPRSRARTCPTLVEQARARGRRDPRADRRGALPRRARVGHARRLARRRAGAAGPARGRGASSTEQAARAGVALHVEGEDDATAEVRPRMLGVVAKNLAENAIRYAGPGTNATLSVRREDGVDGPERGRRRRRRRAVRPAAPLRALLPRRPFAALAGNRARPRDRQARRRLRRRHGRGPRRARPRARDPLLFPLRS